MTDIHAFDAAAERAANRLARENSRILEVLGKRIAKIRNSKKNTELGFRFESEAEANKLLQSLDHILSKAVADGEMIVSQAGELAGSQAIAFFEHHGLELLPQQKAALIENMLASVQQITGGAFTNLANTSAIGVRSVGLDGRVIYRGFREAYMDIVDRAITDMATGGGFEPAFRQALRQFADSGVRIVDYASGWSQRLDSFLRRSILDGVRDIWQANHNRVGAAFGADGVELSAHGGCADDHLPYQGKQFSNRQFKRLQSDLERPIGYWNCRHIAFPILMGISRPAHTASELARLYEMSTRTVEFEGREYTTYEATQLQRRIETAIRQAKDRAILAAAAGDDITRRREQARINVLRDKYMELSKRFGLPVRADRMRVSGFRPVSAGIN